MVASDIGCRLAAANAQGKYLMIEPDEMGLTPEAAQGYEDLFVPAIFSQWPSKIIAAAELNEDAHLLEVGCGTGVLAREAIQQVGVNGSVTGLDLSESMLGVARNLCPDADFHQGNAMNLPFEDNSFDVAVASFVLMFVPDQALAVKEMWRVLKPGGRLIISVWESLDENPAYAELVRIATSRIDETAGESLAWPFALGEQGKLSEICRSAGVNDMTTTSHAGRAKFPSIDGFVRTEIEAWVLADSVNKAALDAVLEDSRTTLTEYCSDTGAIDIPFNALFAVAKKAS